MGTYIPLQLGVEQRFLAYLTGISVSWRFYVIFDVLTSFSAELFDANILERSWTEDFFIEKRSYLGVKFIKQYIFKSKCTCRRKCMQEKESVMVVRWELEIPSLGITVRHHSASLVMPSSYPRDGIFIPHLTIIKDSYIQRQSSTRPHPSFVLLFRVVNL